MKNDSNDYVIRVLNSPLDVDASQWNELLAAQDADGVPNPFMRHEYLAAMHLSGSATPDTGWTPRFVTLWLGDALVAGCALYLKAHSYGEYVFDWAWANAYQQHGLKYYPKALVAAPFTPVPGARLLARNAKERARLIKAVIAWCEEEKLSSLHLLFAADDDISACEEAGMMLRHTVQFHWSNRSTSKPVEAPASPDTTRYRDFDDFLMSLNQEKRKKIRQERRKVVDAGVTFRCSSGTDIGNADWDFFYQCYERTYYEHGNAPYLSRDFFQRMQDTMPANWLMFIAEHTDGQGQKQAIASSLIAVNGSTAYGRYWGALARVDCLHFEACYYQPLEWCIAHGYQTFEGGAQGEHKMARALLPVKTTSAHWLAHPAFADAVERFLEREGAGIENYVDDLGRRSPFRAWV
ncbi:MAG: GNAT family N-acetyltransferase [Pseudomonadota bacterium]